MTTPTTAAPDRLGRARLALEGLSTADAFGEQLMHAGPCAATHLADYAGGLWACGAVGGDVDTTCAMVGGIVVGAVGLDAIPAEWRAAREPLP